MELGFEIQKTNIGTRIRNLEITVYQFPSKTNNSEMFGTNLPKNEFWGQNFKN